MNINEWSIKIILNKSVFLLVFIYYSCNIYYINIKYEFYIGMLDIFVIYINKVFSNFNCKVIDEVNKEVI